MAIISDDKETCVNPIESARSRTSFSCPPYLNIKDNFLEKLAQTKGANFIENFFHPSFVTKYYLGNHCISNFER